MLTYSQDDFRAVFLPQQPNKKHLIFLTINFFLAIFVQSSGKLSLFFIIQSQNILGKWKCKKKWGVAIERIKNRFLIWHNAHITYIYDWRIEFLLACDATFGTLCSEKSRSIYYQAYIFISVLKHCTISNSFLLYLWIWIFRTPSSSEVKEPRWLYG